MQNPGLHFPNSFHALHWREIETAILDGVRRHAVMVLVGLVVLGGVVMQPARMLTLVAWTFLVAGVVAGLEYIFTARKPQRRDPLQD